MSTTVKQLAERFNKPVEELLDTLKKSGVERKGTDDVISDDQMQEFLAQRMSSRVSARKPKGNFAVSGKSGVGVVAVRSKKRKLQIPSAAVEETEKERPLSQEAIVQSKKSTAKQEVKKSTIIKKEPVKESAKSSKKSAAKEEATRKEVKAEKQVVAEPVVNQEE